MVILPMCKKVGEASARAHVRACVVAGPGEEGEFPRGLWPPLEISDARLRSASEHWCRPIPTPLAHMLRFSSDRLDPRNTVCPERAASRVRQAVLARSPTPVPCTCSPLESVNQAKTQRCPIAQCNPDFLHVFCNRMLRTNKSEHVWVSSRPACQQ